MDVKMKHRLTRARAYIEHSAVPLFDVALAGDLRRRKVAAADGFGVLSLRFL